ncbi:hypothetical protein [Butyrivibrio sp. TB]|uniref:hypothetical protein n=1 Tax=Butyrivibrio sp. TB TaxID=1520809 RepID=UPI0008C9415D|nr:hypothetical protein [Butyrivibrio sp. TB]SEQ35931.1 hypothetical protein SAMN02910382_02751 [Butyrivibrio sp. TB]
MKITKKKLAGIMSGIKQSAYIKWLGNNRNSIIISLLISVFITILSYPGIIYIDSYVRISFTDSLKTSIKAFLTGESALYPSSSWLTITPSFFILLSKEIVGSIILYTFAQCFFHWFLTIVFIDQINEKQHPVWNKICLFLSPVMWAFGVYYEASVGCTIAILAILLLIWKWRVLQSRFDKVITIIFIIGFSFVCFGYRANAFSIIPAVIIIVLLREKKLLARLLLSMSVLLGFFASTFLPSILNIRVLPSYSAGFAWEIVSVIQSMEPDKQYEYIDYLDDLFGDGATAVAVQNNSYDEQGSSINGMFNSPITSMAISEADHSTRLVKRYVKMALYEPKLFLKMKWEFVSHSLGIGKPVNMAEYYYQTWDPDNEFGLNDSHQRAFYVDFFLAFMEFNSIIRRPWIMYMLSLVLILIWRFKHQGRKAPINLYEAAFLVSLFYYGAYLLNTQAFEYRYYYPSWLLSFAIIIGLIPQLFFGSKRSKKITLAVCIFIAVVSLAGGYKEYSKTHGGILASLDNVDTTSDII